MEQVLIIIAILAVVIVAAGGTFLLRPSRRARRPGGPPPGQAGPAAGQDDRADLAGSDLAGTGQAPSAVLPPVAEPSAGLAERPPPSRGRMIRLRGRLARSQSAFGSVLLGLLSRDVLDDQAWEEIEDTLLTADVGVGPAHQIVGELRTQVKVSGTRTGDEVRAMLRSELIRQVGADMDRSLRTQRHGDRPAVLLVVGVNGTGKTTACGKLARALIGDGQTVLLGAAGGDRGGGGHRHRGYRGAAALEDRADGRAGQDQAGHREARHGG